MIFNSFTVANDYNFGAQWPNGCGHRFFFPANKTVGGMCLGLIECDEEPLWLSNVIEDDAIFWVYI